MNINKPLSKKEIIVVVCIALALVMIYDLRRNHLKTQADYSAALAEAVAAEQKKDWDATIADYDKALSIKPGDLIANQLRHAAVEEHFSELLTKGKSSEDNNNCSAAYDLYKQALLIKPGDPTAEQRRQFIIPRFYPELLENIRLTEQYLKSLDDNYLLGQDLDYNEIFGSKKAEGIKREASYYDRIIEILPDCAMAYNNRGIINICVSDLNKAIVIKPAYAIAYNNLATMTYNNENDNKQREKGDSDDVISDFSKAIQNDSSVAVFYYNRGVVEITREHIADAIADLNVAITLNQNFTDAYKMRGILKQNIEHNYTGAIADYNKAIEIYSQGSTKEPDYLVKLSIENLRCDIVYAQKEELSSWIAFLIYVTDQLPANYRGAR